MLFILAQKSYCVVSYVSGWCVFLDSYYARTFLGYNAFYLSLYGSNGLNSNSPVIALSIIIELPFNKVVQEPAVSLQMDLLQQMFVIRS